MIPAEDATTLSLLFHLNSEPWLNEAAYRATPYYQEFKEIQGVRDRVALPAPPRSALMELINRRRSVRAYAERSLPVELVSALAAAAYGAAEIAQAEGGGEFLRRSVPSGGGLYPLEIFLFLRRVDGLADGLYHYDVRGHALELMQAGNQGQALQSVFYTFPFMYNANAVFCLAAVFPRTQKKYGPRGYRYILLEAGHSAQNICLAAAESGLGSLCMGGFVDSRLNRMLALDPAKEGVVYAVAVDHG
jgi:SagB-type dehydrogenase family enzyme